MTPEQLRASLLQQAMEGKLVKQDPNDEPASVLLEKITKEKDRLIKEKKIKRTKKLPEITNDEKPFEIPDSWEWVRIGNLIKPEIHIKPTQSFEYVDIASLDNSKNKIVNTKFIQIPEKKAPVRATQLIENGDILYSTVRPYLKNIAIVPSNLDHSIATSGFCVLKPINKLITKYLFVSCLSPYTTNEMHSRMKGLNSPAIKKSDLLNWFIPLPPLAEQKRIVARLDQLMPLVDEYAEAYDKLKKLDDGFNDKLKQSLLQYAMEGKLVKQDPNDEPASVLLEKIAEEKARLIREKKIKRTKKLPEITDDEKPFAIPDSWEWAYLSDVANITKLAGFEYTKYIKPNLKDNGIPLFKAKNIHNGEINYQFENFITEEQSDNLIRSQLNKKCLLTPYVGSIGNVAIFPGTFKAHLGSNVGKIELLGFNKLSLLEEFVMEYLKSPQGYIQLTKHLKSTAQPSISITALREVILPIPPLVEQKRIVAKIDQLMATIH